MSKAAMQQALNLLKSAYVSTALIWDRADCVESLEAALAQPEQEPLNTMPTKIVGPNLEQILNAAGFYRREWVGLTDEDINKSWEWAQKSSPYGVTRIETFAKSIEAQLRKKNG